MPPFRSLRDHEPGWSETLSSVPSWMRRTAAEDHDLVARPSDVFVLERLLNLLSLVYLARAWLAGWQARDTVHGALGLAAVIVFTALYVWHLVASRPLRLAWIEGYDGPRAPWPVLLRYAGLVALTVLATVLLGQSGAVTWVFLAMSGLWTFRGALPYGIAAGLIGLYEVLARRLETWQRDDSLGIALGLAVLAVTGLMLATRRSSDLAAARRENARLAVEEERNRVARDVHDILGHSLTVITVKAELAARLLEIDPERARAEVEQVEALAREALADVRGAVEGFREISLSGELARAREALTAAGIEARLPRRVDTVDPGLRELYAWAVREGVTNVIRHSGARVCSVTIDEDGLRLRDDGRVAAPAPGARPAGHGLQGLAERAHAAGATLSARRLEPSGFELVLAAAPGEVNGS